MTANSEVIENAIDRAREARKRAHAPYSKFYVGAAVIDADRIVTAARKVCYR